MNNRQFKNRFLVSEINQALTRAALRTHQPEAFAHEINRALAFARQLPDNPKHRALRAYIITAREALAHV